MLSAWSGYRPPAISADARMSLMLFSSSEDSLMLPAAVLSLTRAGLVEPGMGITCRRQPFPAGMAALIHPISHSRRQVTGHQPATARHTISFNEVDQASAS